MIKENKVLVAKDAEGNQFVVIPQVIFKGKRSISWKNVEKYLIRYIGEIFENCASHSRYFSLQIKSQD